MGCWGYGPFDNDRAGDMIAKLSQDVKRVAEAKTDAAARWRYDSARAAAQVMLLAHGTDILGGPSIELAVEALARMRSDTAWLASMREPKRLAKRLDEELNAVLAHMRACEGCRKKYKRKKHKKDFVVLVKLVQAATRVKVPKAASFGVRRKKSKSKKAKRKRA